MPYGDSVACAECACCRVHVAFFPDRAIKLHDQRLRELEDNQRRKMLLASPADSQGQPSRQRLRKQSHAYP